MLTFFLNAIGALIGIFFALFLATHLIGKEWFLGENPAPEKTVVSELAKALPDETVVALTEGVPKEMLEKVAEPVATTSETRVPETPPPPEKPVAKETPPPPLAPPPPSLTATELNSLVRAATVNIFCTLDGGLEALSGSGVVIDPRGIVLTNAHVAQYFLLDTRRGGEKFVSCDIRTGSPAKNTWKGVLLYIPSLWVEAHAQEIDAPGQADTGEHDYALVRITPLSAQAGPSDGTATSSFPALSLGYDGAGIVRDESVLLASYPAGFLDAESIYKNLWQISSIASIKELYNFASSSREVIDVFSVAGVIGAQEGSSGGAVARARDGALLGLVTTRSKGDTTGERELFSLSLPYINKDIEHDIQKSLEDFLASDLAAYETWFHANVRPAVRERLLQAIKG